MKRIFVFLIALLIYVTMSELSAKRKAELFCDSVTIGNSSDNLFEKAIEAGARKNSTYWEDVNSLKYLYATFTGYYPGSDFICKIDAKNGIVVAKHPSLITSLLN
ncbi:MAG: hypothetical protein KA538_06670 [Azonexus sp.]|jgi:hypothetical protein|nr:hypothetical protein [Azonexus sp.]